MDAVAVCTCSLPTTGLPRHLPLTLSVLPRTAPPATGRRRQLPGPSRPSSRAPARTLPGTCGRFARCAVGGSRPDGSPETRRDQCGRQREPRLGGGSPQETSATPEKLIVPVRRCSAGTPCSESSAKPVVIAPVGHTACVTALPVLYPLKKSVTKPNTNINPEQLRDITSVCLLLNLDADRISLQCRNHNYQRKYMPAASLLK